MNGSDDARSLFDKVDSGISEDTIAEYAWEHFLEAAISYEPFHDEDGERLPEFSDDELMKTEVWRDYCVEFCATFDEIQMACDEWDKCGGDPYTYYGVSRSDFA